MKRRELFAVALTFLGFAGSGWAAENADPSGTWKWSFMGQNNQSREVTLKLKLEGDKLTGTISGRDNSETNISDATFKDGQVAFSATRERNGNKFTQKYSGKLDGKAIKGKIEFERDGQTQSRDWEAKKE